MRWDEAQACAGAAQLATKSPSWVVLFSTHTRAAIDVAEGRRLALGDAFLTLGACLTNRRRSEGAAHRAACGDRFARIAGTM
jgi:hypothetical protein